MWIWKHNVSRAEKSTIYGYTAWTRYAIILNYMSPSTYRIEFNELKELSSNKQFIYVPADVQMHSML